MLRADRRGWGAVGGGVVRAVAGPGDTNPYLGLLAAALRGAGVAVGKLNLSGLRGGRAGLVVHVHWPEFALLGSPRRVARGCVRLLGLLVVARVRGVPVVWTAHNVQGHEREHPWVAVVFWWLFTRLVSGTVLLHGAGEQMVLARHRALRRRPRYVTGHGRVPLPVMPDRQVARAALGCPAVGTVLAQTGQVRGYKDPGPLLAAARAAGAQDPGRAPFVIVAGDCPDRALRAAVTADVVGDRDGEDLVLLRLHRLSDDELGLVLAACDVVAQPYRAHLSSSSIFLAFEAGRRVLVPATPVTDALAADVGAGWLLRYTPPLTGPVLRDLLAAPVPAVAPDLSAQAWPAVAARTTAAYQAVLHRR